MTPGEPKYNSKTADKFVVRLPEGMRDQIAVEARRNHRSMNSEIVSRLDMTLVDGYRPDDAVVATADAAAQPAGDSSDGAMVPVALSEAELRFVRRLRQLNERKRRALYDFIG